MNSENLSKSGQFISVIVFFLSLAYIALLHKSYFYIYDEGEITAATLRIVRGQVIYRDFFTFRPPGLLYLMAFLYSIFGFKTAVTKAVIIISLSAISTLTFVLARRLMNSILWALLPVIFFLSYGPTNWYLLSPHWFSTLTALLSVCSLLFYYSKNLSIKFLVSAGFAAGLTILFLQTRGILLCAGVLTFLFLQNILLYKNREIRLLFYEISIFLSSVFLTLIPFLIYLIVNEAVPEAYYALVVWPMQNYSKMGRYPEYYFIGKQLIHDILKNEGIIRGMVKIPGFILLGYSPFFAFFGSIPVLSFLFKKDKEYFRTYLLYLLTGVALFLSVVYRSDIVHMLFQLPLTMCIFFFIIRLMVDMSSGKALLLRLSGQMATVLLGLYLFNLFFYFFTIPYIYNKKFLEVKTPAGSFYTLESREAVESWNYFFSTLKNVKDNEIFVYAHAPNIYFDLGVINPTRYDYAMPGQFADEQLDEILHDLERSKPRYIVYDRLIEKILISPEKSGYPMADIEKIQNDPVRRFIFTHYKPLTPFSNLIIMERKE